MKKFILFLLIIFFIAVSSYLIYYFFAIKNEEISPPLTDIKKEEKTIDFEKVNSVFLFSSKIQESFEVEYDPIKRVINIYDPNISANSNIEKSQIYITFFRASNFLTLKTVNITQQDKISINGKEAILYEITKKETVPNFAGQPSWRNSTHKAIDIRYSNDNPTYFYSFAKNPDLSEDIFNKFINLLVFY